MPGDYEFGLLTQSVKSLTDEIKDMKSVVRDMTIDVEKSIDNGIKNHCVAYHRSDVEQKKPPTWLDPILRYVLPPLVAAFLGAFGMKSVTEQQDAPAPQVATSSQSEGNP